MNRKFLGCFSALILVVFASCQSSSSDPEPTGPQRVMLELSVDADHKVPDSISWMLGRDSGDAHLAGMVGKTGKTDFESPRPVGSELLWLDLWVDGMRTMRAPHVWNGSAVVVSSKDRVVYDSVALRLLGKIDSLRHGPDSIPRTRSGFVSLYASWLLAGDARSVGFPGNCPVGLDPTTVVRELVRRCVQESLSVAIASRTWGISIGADSIASIVHSLVGEGAIRSSDSAILFPPPPVRVGDAIGLDAANLVAGGSQEALKGTFLFSNGAAFARMSIVDSLGKEADSLFRWRSAKPAVGVKIWDLADASLAAGSSASGKYRVNIAAFDDDSDSAIAAFDVVVTVPARPVLSAQGIPAELSVPEDSSVRLSLKLSAWHGDSIRLELRSKDDRLIPSTSAWLVPGSDSSFELSIVPAKDANGSTPVVVVVSDSLDSTKSTIAVLVEPRNDAPTFSVAQGEIVVSGSGEKIVTNWARSIASGPLDEAGQTTRFEFQTISGAELFAELPKIDSVGTLRFRPNVRTSGSAAFRVRLRDDGDSSAGSKNVGAWQALEIVVNSAPTLTLPVQRLEIWENEASELGSLVIGDLETSVGALVFAKSSSNEDLIPSDSISVFVSGATRRISLHPISGKWGTCTLYFEVRDTLGASTRDSVRVLVKHVNRAPEITAESLLVVSALSYGNAMEIEFAYSVAGGEGDLGQSMTRNVSLRDPADASLFSVLPTLTAKGLSFTPLVPGSGTVWLRLYAKDGDGTEHGGVDTASYDFRLVFTDTVIDARDGRVYRFRRIGGQTWMTENSRWTPPSGVRWMNGDSTQGQVYANIKELHLGTTCEFAERASQCTMRQVDAPCPSGWRMSTENDWTALSRFVSGGTPSPDGHAKLFAADKSWWSSSWVGTGRPDTVFAKATDEMGFHLKANGIVGGGSPEGGFQSTVFRVALPNPWEKTDHPYLELSASSTSFLSTSTTSIDLPVRCMR